MLYKSNTTLTFYTIFKLFYLPLAENAAMSYTSLEVDLRRSLKTTLS